MAASDEFPRSIILTSDVTGAAASITLAAYPGIAWVIDNINAETINTGATALSFSINDGVITFLVGSVDASSGAGSIPSWSGSCPGPKEYPINTQVTIAYGNSTAGTRQGLQVTAHAV